MSEALGIVAISAPFPGVSRVLEEGEKLGLWKFVRLGGQVTIPPARAYILGAWHSEYKMLLGNLGGKLGMLWTSSTGEMEMEPIEVQYLFQALADPRIEFIWFGDESLARAFPQKGFHASYPLATDLKIPLEGVEKRNAIALFNPGGLKKNNLNQLLAVALFQRDQPGWVLETNLGAFRGVMDTLGIKYHLHPWLPREQYHQILASCRVNLAVSWAETFNYQVAEAGLLGVPSVVSPTVPLPGFRVQDPNDPLNIALVLHNPPSIFKDIRERVLKVAEHNNQLLAVALAHL